MSELRAGALVQHEDGRAGVLVEGPIGWAVRINGAVGSFAWRGALEDHGWSLVGETGFAPEEARLAWVGKNDVAFAHAQDGQDKINMSETLSVVDRLAALNPIVSVEGEEK